MANMSNYLENKLIDHVCRGQTFTAPTNLVFDLCTSATDDAGGGTEVTGGNYAPVSIACSLNNFAGTQGAGTTVASNGTGGLTSNNVAITFPAPTGANWGTVTHFKIKDAAGGNVLYHGALTTPRTVNAGDAAPSFGAAAFGLTLA